MNNGTFWRAKCRITGVERKFWTGMNPPQTFEAMREWVNRFYRNLDLLEYAPWDNAEHGGTLYPVPVHHVKFDAKPTIAVPDRARRSLWFGRPLGGRSLLSGRSLLKGATNG